MPEISVIIPVYNGDKTIRETIESVLNQTFSDFELLIINDGSQDTTLEIVSNIPDPRIKVFSYPNAGLNASRNRGISLASGEYVSFIDADDIWTPDKLEAQLKALKAEPQAAVAYSWTDWIDEKGQFLRRANHNSATGDVFAKLLLADFVGSGSNPLIRKQAFAEVGNFDQSLVGGQDWDMWLRLAARYPFTVVPSAQILYRQSPNSWSRNVERQEKGFRRIIEKALAQAPESVQKLEKHIIANRYKCLTFDVFQKGVPGRQRGLTGARYLWQVVSNEPDMLQRRVTWKVLIQIAMFILLPPQQAKLLRDKMKQLSNVEALLFHVRVDPEQLQ